MEEHQSPIDGDQGIADLATQKQVRAQFVGDLVAAEFDEEFGAGRGFSRDLFQDAVEHEPGHGPPPARNLPEGFPPLVQFDPVVVLAYGAQLDTAVPVPQPLPVVGEAAQKTAQLFGVAVVPQIPEPLVDRAQGEVLPVLLGIVRGIGRAFLHHLQHGLFEDADVLKVLQRRILHLVAHKGGHQDALFHQPHLGHGMEHAHDLFARGRVVGSCIVRLFEGGQFGQLVDIQALIRIRVEQHFQDGFELPLQRGG